MAKEEQTYTKYEKARMIGSRALQISMGAPFLVKVTPKKLEELKYNPIEVAKIEFDEGVLPITVKRPMPDTRKRKEKPEAKKEAKAEAKKE